MTRSTTRKALARRNSSSLRTGRSPLTCPRLFPPPSPGPPSAVRKEMRAMILLSARRLVLRPLAAVLLLGGLGAVGCGQKAQPDVAKSADSSPAAGQPAGAATATPAGQPATDPQADPPA